MRIRDAGLDDSEAISRVHVASTRTTYAHLLPQEFLAQLSTAERTDRWREFFSDKSGQLAVVAEDPAMGVVGFASGGPERTGGLGFSGELWSVYLLQSAQRAGLGRRLVSAVARRLTGLGHKSLLVWVLAENPSRAFYEKLGGQYVTEKVIEWGGESLVEMAYGWKDVRILMHRQRG